MAQPTQPTQTAQELLSEDNIKLLETMPHSDLLSLRSSIPDDSPLHDKLAPYEHRAFAREYAQENPVLAAISMPASIPGYSIAKAVGLTSGRSAPSLQAVIQGYAGLAEGLSTAFKKQSNRK